MHHLGAAPSTVHSQRARRGAGGRQEPAPPTWLSLRSLSPLDCRRDSRPLQGPQVRSHPETAPHADSPAPLRLGTNLSGCLAGWCNPRPAPPPLPAPAPRCSQALAGLAGGVAGVGQWVRRWGPVCAAAVHPPLSRALIALPAAWALGALVTRAWHTAPTGRWPLLPGVRPPCPPCPRRLAPTIGEARCARHCPPPVPPSSAG
jgi:hypothetical protein